VPTHTDITDPAVLDLRRIIADHDHGQLDNETVRRLAEAIVAAGWRPPVT
jgi:hypothetical protein